MNRDNPKNTSSSENQHSRVFDWAALVICFLSAFFIWFYVMQVDSPEYEDVISGVTIEIINTDVLEQSSNLSIYSGYGNLIEVKLIGKKSDISKLTPEDITAYVDAAGIKTSGSHSLDVHVTTPPGITLAGTSLNAINVYADEKSTATVQIKVKFAQVTVAKPYELGIPEPEYDTVTLTGPKSALENISHAQVSLSLGNISASVTAIGEIVLISKDGTEVDNPYVKMSRSEVKATVPVFCEKTVPLKVGFVHGFLNETNSEITLYPQEVTIKGDPIALEEITEIVVTTIDEKKLSGDITKTVSIIPGDGITIVSGHDTANISVKLKNTSLRSITVTEIDAQDATVPYEIIDSSVKVTLRGSTKDLSAIKQSDVLLKVDMSEFTEDMHGTFTARAIVIIDVATESPVYEVGEYTVQVQIGMN